MSSDPQLRANIEKKFGNDAFDRTSTSGEEEEFPLARNAITTALIRINWIYDQKLINAVNDYLGYYSSNNGNASRHPVFTINYTLAD
ncbi:hypothetical protein [Congregibacter litoralis]|uniref:Uncharacterized protein n=1 Tax=Congregibacter litoralis KT71 TaxID=314285 RepID=A4ACT7_9GAMM|nr:hypothetical protein [Congregibacter litoralis]EAQ96128.1 hypothetical protein KT71_18721 [Congregibacter litoralis KT71]